MKQSPVQVIAILQRHSNNINARRWLKDPAAIDQILENHLAWNEDHADQPEMILSLEDNITDYLYTPQKIDGFPMDKKEQPE